MAKQGLSSERSADDQNHENEDVYRHFSADFASMSLGVNHVSAPDEASGIDERDKRANIFLNQRSEVEDERNLNYTPSMRDQTKILNLLSAY